MSEAPTPRPVKIAVGMAVIAAIGAAALTFGVFRNLAKAPEPALTPVKAISPEDMACNAAFARTVYNLHHRDKPEAERAAIEALHNTPAEGNLLLNGCAAAWNSDTDRLAKSLGKASSFECADNADILLRLTQIERAGVSDTQRLEALRARVVGVSGRQCAGVPFPRR